LRWHDHCRCPNLGGPSFQTCANAASICRAIENFPSAGNSELRHHAEVAGLAVKEADRLLHWAQSTIATTGPTEIAQTKFQERMPSSDVEKMVHQPAPLRKKRAAGHDDCVLNLRIQCIAGCARRLPAATSRITEGRLGWRPRIPSRLDYSRDRTGLTNLHRAISGVSA